jgi:hypothetical protein
VASPETFGYTLVCLEFLANDRDISVCDLNTVTKTRNFDRNRLGIVKLIEIFCIQVNFSYLVVNSAQGLFARIAVD